jgi:hypothetical protein
MDFNKEEWKACFSRRLIPNVWELLLTYSLSVFDLLKLLVVAAGFALLLETLGVVEAVRMLVGVVVVLSLFMSQNCFRTSTLLFSWRSCWSRGSP